MASADESSGQLPGQAVFAADEFGSQVAKSDDAVVSLGIVRKLLYVSPRANVGENGGKHSGGCGVR